MSEQSKVQIIGELEAVHNKGSMFIKIGVPFDRLMLNREEVVLLLPILQRFVDTGSIEERPSISKSEQKRIACQRGISVDELNQQSNESEAAT